MRSIIVAITYLVERKDERASCPQQSTPAGLYQTRSLLRERLYRCVMQHRLTLKRYVYCCYNLLNPFQIVSQTTSRHITKTKQITSLPFKGH
jgi:hypothetical protein